MGVCVNRAQPTVLSVHFCPIQSELCKLRGGQRFPSPREQGHRAALEAWLGPADAGLSVMFLFHVPQKENER